MSTDRNEESCTSSIARPEQDDETRSGTPSYARSENERDCRSYLRSVLPVEGVVGVSDPSENMSVASDGLGGTKPLHSSSEGSGSESVLSERTRPVVKITTRRRERGRPPTHGKYVGLAKAQSEFTAAQRRAEREKLSLSEDSRTAAVTHKVVAGRQQLAGTQSLETEAVNLTSAHLRSQLEGELEAIWLVSSQSKGLKGKARSPRKSRLPSSHKSVSCCFIERYLRKRRSWRRRMLVYRLKSRYSAGNKKYTEMEKQRCERMEEAAESELSAMVRKELAEFLTTLSVLKGRLLRPPLKADHQPASSLLPPMASSYAAKTATLRQRACISAADIPAPQAKLGARRRLKIRLRCL